MAWTAPRTWVVGEILTAANMNTHLRDQFLVIESGSKGQHLIMNDAENAPTYSSGIDIIDRDLNLVDVVNTADEASIYSHTIDAGSLGATGGFRLTLGGSMLVAVAGLIKFRIKLGATSVFLTDATAPTVNANRERFRWEILCMNSAADAQKWVTDFMSRATSNAGFALGTGDSALIFEGVGDAPSAEDTSGALLLDVTVDWSLASASLSFRKEIAVLERIAA